MAGRIPTAVLISAFFITLFSPLLSADTVLVRHDFDDDMLESGPDTFQVFINRQSRAEISNRYARSGYASAHLTDKPFDRDFVEFQGYFPLQNSGNIHIEFSFLVTSLDNAFNVALVGEKRYQMNPDGINFWLLYQNGWLRHKSNGIPKKLFQPQIMQWYHVSAVLDMDTGRYNLRIDDEAGTTVKEAHNQFFAPGPARHYSLKEFSFTGDLSDRQATDLYIDELVITTTNNDTLPEKVAPGRRQYFVEQWNNYHKKLQGKLQCLPARNLKDFAIDDDAFAYLVTNNQLEKLYQLTRPHNNPDAVRIDTSSPVLKAIIAWRKACYALEAEDINKATEQIAIAINNNPESYIIRLAKIMIDAAYHKDIYSAYYPATELAEFDDDIRTPIALAMIAFQTGEQTQIDTDVMDIMARLNEKDLKLLRKTGAQPIGEQYRSHLHHYMPENWQTYLQWLVALEQRYYALLWQGRENEAGELAANVSAVFNNAQITPGIWLERQGDALFFTGRYQDALLFYQKALMQQFSRDALLLKMADIYHILGDAAAEKEAREMIFHNFSRQ